MAKLIMMMDVGATRAALCQVFDSIFLDVPMSRVKFNVNTEYAYIQNFKVLQSMCPVGVCTACLDVSLTSAVAAQIPLRSTRSISRSPLRRL